jgi:hypothetical protein
MLSFKLSVCYPQSFYLSPPPIAFYLFNLFHVVSFYLSLSEISLPVIFCVIIIFFSFAGTFHLPAVISPTCIFYDSSCFTLHLVSRLIFSLETPQSYFVRPDNRSIDFLRCIHHPGKIHHCDRNPCEWKSVHNSPSSNGNNIRMSPHVH